MPVRLQERVYRGVYDVLSGKDRSEKFARLSEDDRRAILEILRDTKRGLPDYYFGVTAPASRKLTVTVVTTSIGCPFSLMGS